VGVPTDDFAGEMVIVEHRSVADHVRRNHRQGVKWKGGCSGRFQSSWLRYFYYSRKLSC
jgi:hypothetical protein